jgi:hypothetical protein
MRLKRTRLRVTILAGAVCAALIAFAGSADAATYPGGGSGFDEGAEGWSAGGASCTPAELLCTSEATYDATTGNPPGSIAAKTTVTVNLVGLFKGTATWNSPQFTVPVEAITGAEMHLDRAFDPGGLVDLEPKATFTVTLADLSVGTSTTALSGELDGEDKAFAGASAPVAVVGGHTYRLSIDSTTAQSTAAVSLLSGTSSLRFDNVGLAVRSASGGKGGSGGGAGGKGSGSNSSSLSDRRLFSLLSSNTAASPALFKGKRLFVKIDCPAKVGHTCRITAQGLLNKRKPATVKRTVKVPKGKSKRIALRVKPKARGKVAKRKRLLFREKVHAGTAQATVYRQRKLIRRG